MLYGFSIRCDVGVVKIPSNLPRPIRLRLECVNNSASYVLQLTGFLVCSRTRHYGSIKRPIAGYHEFLDFDRKFGSVTSWAARVSDSVLGCCEQAANVVTTQIAVNGTEEPFMRSSFSSSQESHPTHPYNIEDCIRSAVRKHVRLSPAAGLEKHFGYNPVELSRGVERL